MVFGNTLQRERIGRWVALAFIIAGVFGLAKEVLYQLGSPEAIRDLVLILTYTAVIIGLVGVHSILSPRSPRLSRIGLVTAGITGISIIAAVAGKYLLGPPASSEVLLYLSGLVSVAFYACSTLSFLAFGVASLRTEVLGRFTGYLFLVVVASRLVTLAGMTVVSSVLFATPLLALSYLLWSRQVPVREVSQSWSSTTR